MRVVAIEPHPLLARHLSRLFPRDVRVLSCALSDRVGHATLYLPSHQGRELDSRNSLEIGVNPGCELRTIEVETQTLDSLDLRDVAMMKIDVEGHELEVLRGAGQLLRRERPVLLVEIEERHHPGGSQVVFQLAEDHGYEGYFFWRDAWRSVTTFDPALHQRPDQVKQADAVKSSDYVNNFLFLREGQAARLGRPPGRPSS
jgi:FkbM family methyltransferase